MAKNVKDLAGEMSAQFTTDKRSNGDVYYHLKDGHRGTMDWMNEVCYAGHKDGSPGPFSSMLPDDYRYEMINDCLDVLSESDDEDEAREQLDGKVPVYTGQLTAWLASNVNRPGYCDEAVSEGLVDGSDIMQTISCGYLRELEEVFSEILRALEAEAERREELQDELDAVLERAEARAQEDRRNFVVYRILDMDVNENFREVPFSDGAPQPGAAALYIVDSEGNVAEVAGSEKHRP